MSALPRFRRIVLHVGLSKTGSTSLQRTLQRNREWLAARGILFPLVTYRDQAFGNHSIPLICAVTDAPQRYVPGLRQRYGDDPEALASDCRAQLDALLRSASADTLVFSGELLEWVAPPDLHRLCEWLGPYTQRLEALAFVRSPQSGLASLLQERLKAGALLEPADLVGRTRRKIDNLEAGFGQRLNLRNYHEAVVCAGGVVGDFLGRLEVPAAGISALEPVRSNQRMSMEAYRLMRGINQRLPKSEQARHGVARTHRDLDPLLALKGEPFRLAGFAGSQLYRDCLAEARELERRLGWRFPAEVESEPGPVWTDPAVASLDAVVPRLPHEALREAAVASLRDEAAALERTRPEAARRLRTAIERFSRKTAPPTAG